MPPTDPQTPGPAVDLIEHAAGIIVAKQREPHTAPYHWAGALWEAGMLCPPGHAGDAAANLADASRGLADPTPIPAEALEAAIGATDRHYTAEFDGVIPVCRCGSREDDHETRVILAAAAPILLAAGRTAAAEDIRSELETLGNAADEADRPDVKTATPVETQHITATCRENKTHYVAWEHAVHLLRHVYDAQVARDPSATISIAVYRTSNPDSGVAAAAARVAENGADR